MGVLVWTATPNGRSENILPAAGCDGWRVDFLGKGTRRYKEQSEQAGAATWASALFAVVLSAIGNLSCRKCLRAKDPKVGLREHTAKRIKKMLGGFGEMFF